MRVGRRIRGSVARARGTRRRVSVAARSGGGATRSLLIVGSAVAGLGELVRGDGHVRVVFAWIVVVGIGTGVGRETHRRGGRDGGASEAGSGHGGRVVESRDGRRGGLRVHALVAVVRVVAGDDRPDQSESAHRGG